jgi:hypothetical protein
LVKPVPMKLKDGVWLCRSFIGSLNTPQRRRSLYLRLLPVRALRKECHLNRTQ